MDCASLCGTGLRKCCWTRCLIVFCLKEQLYCVLLYLVALTGYFFIHWGHIDFLLWHFLQNTIVSRHHNQMKKQLLPPLYRVVSSDKSDVHWSTIVISKQPLVFVLVDFFCTLLFVKVAILLCDAHLSFRHSTYHAISIEVHFVFSSASAGLYSMSLHHLKRIWLYTKKWDDFRSFP